MTDAAVPSSNPDEAERSVLRATLVNRRHRLAQLPESALGPNVVGLLADVDAALDRLERSSFGTCTNCAGNVEIDRLRADPTTTICLDCLSQPERRALEHDLELAWQVQESLLPPHDFVFDDWVGHYLYRPHGAVGGDYVDVLPVEGDNNKLLVMLGDVSGKGVAAALLMSHLHALFHATASTGATLAEVMNRASRLLCAAAPSNVYATLVAARLQSGGAVELCTAGHTPPLLVTDTGVRELATDCLPLGLFCETPYTTRSLQLEPGDALILYSDGVSESINPDELEFGTPGLRAAVEKASWQTATDLVNTVSGAALQHRHGAAALDDISVMAICRQTTPT
ncbi:MAG: SpoIIE family protein phosphatase [bacterium]|nr:SpoIIE family protein phosphatase [bacterium]